MGGNQHEKQSKQSIMKTGLAQNNYGVEEKEENNWAYYGPVRFSIKTLHLEISIVVHLDTMSL